jgi:hypothetical protein
MMGGEEKRNSLHRTHELKKRMNEMKGEAMVFLSFMSS